MNATLNHLNAMKLSFSTHNRPLKEQVKSNLQAFQGCTKGKLNPISTVKKTKSQVDVC